MKTTRLKSLGLVLAVLAVAPLAWPHEGHNKAPGEGGEAPGAGPITITAEARKNLGLMVEEAQLRNLEKTLLAIGQIEAIPNFSAAVSSRIPGRIVALPITEGQTVKKGDVAVEIESLQLGDPPPRVKYTVPIDGIVTERHVVIGDTAAPDKHLLEVVNLSEVYAEGQLFEGQITAVKRGQKVRIYVESFPKETFEGTVELLSGSLDPQTRTQKVWVRVKNPDFKLRPNMRARLNIVTAEAESVTTVPHSAVLGEAGHLFVFVQSDTDELVFEKRSVVLGMKDDRYFEVSEGVFPSDKVVVTGNYQLQYVTTRKAPAKADGTNAPAATAHTEPKAGVEDGHEQSHASGSISPLLWMGVTLAALLLANAIILLVKRRAPKSADAAQPVPSLADAREGSK